MGPVVIFRAKEKHREFSNLVLHFLDIWGDVFGMADFGWPPPTAKTTQRKEEIEASVLSETNEHQIVLMHTTLRQRSFYLQIPPFLSSEEE